jgi:hypothetical protein
MPKKALDRPPPKYRRRGREVVMRLSDARDFTAALKAAFPSIVFAVEDRFGPTLTYYPSLDSLSDKRFEIFTCWIPRPRWKPRWVLYSRHDPELGYEFANLPAKFFWFQRSLGLDRFTTPGGRRIEYYTNGQVMATYDVNDREVRAFVDKVYRLLGKLTTNKFALVDSETGKKVDRISHWHFWGGHHALDECRKRPNRFLLYSSYEDKATGHRLRFKPDDAAPALAKRRSKPVNRGERTPRR